MECAGNGRSFLQPKVKGVAWDLGAVGNAEWTGVLLRDVLQRAGVRSGALEVVLEGGDKGTIPEPPRPPGEIHYARSLPIAKASDDVLLAFEMNGQPLPASHGFPLRAVVPGWFGMASVKWLQRIIVTETPFNGYYQSIDYTYWQRRDGMPTLVPLAEMELKAQIARPSMGEVLSAGAPYRVHGAAWAGTEEVAGVEISIDGGGRWSPANLIGESVKNAWRFWEFIWTPGGGEIFAGGAGVGFRWPHPAGAAKRGLRHLCREPLAADRGRGALSSLRSARYAASLTASLCPRIRTVCCSCSALSGFFRTVTGPLERMRSSISLSG